MKRGKRGVEHRQPKRRCRRSKPPVGTELEDLPKEMQFQILAYLSMRDLVSLSEASRAAAKLVEDWLSSSEAARTFSPRSQDRQHSDKLCAYFEELGKMVRDVAWVPTTWRTVQRKIHFIHGFLAKVVEHSQLAENNEIPLEALGYFWIAASWNWKEDDKAKLLAYLEEQEKMGKKVERFLQGDCGVDPGLEMEIRSFYRSHFIAPIELSSAAKERLEFWLWVILKRHTIYHQAKIIFILFGPLALNNKALYWETVNEGHQRPCHHFTGLSKAIKLMWDYRFSKDNVISVIWEITDLPRKWRSENEVMLLFQCGTDFVVNVLMNLTTSGLYNEVSHFIVSTGNSARLSPQGQGIPQCYGYRVAKRVVQALVARSAASAERFLNSLVRAYINQMLQAVDAPAAAVDRQVEALINAELSIMRDCFRHLCP